MGITSQIDQNRNKYTVMNCNHSNHQSNDTNNQKVCRDQHTFFNTRQGCVLYKKVNVQAMEKINLHKIENSTPLKRTKYKHEILDFVSCRYILCEHVL